MKGRDQLEDQRKPADCVEKDMKIMNIGEESMIIRRLLVHPTPEGKVRAINERKRRYQKQEYGTSRYE